MGEGGGSCVFFFNRSCGGSGKIVGRACTRWSASESNKKLAAELHQVVLGVLQFVVCCFSLATCRPDFCFCFFFVCVCVSFFFSVFFFFAFSFCVCVCVVFFSLNCAKGRFSLFFTLFFFGFLVVLRVRVCVCFDLNCFVGLVSCRA